MWILSDRELFPGPEKIDGWEKFSLEFPTCTFTPCRAIWESARDEILPEWIRKFPGTRPTW